MIESTTVNLVKLSAQLTWWASLLVTLRTLGLRFGAYADEAWDAYDSIDNLATNVLHTIVAHIC